MSCHRHRLLITEETLLCKCHVRSFHVCSLVQRLLLLGARWHLVCQRYRMEWLFCWWKHQTSACLRVEASILASLPELDLTDFNLAICTAFVILRALMGGYIVSILIVWHDFDVDTVRLSAPHFALLVKAWCFLLLGGLWSDSVVYV